jgi:hypothetical protein
MALAEVGVGQMLAGWTLSSGKSYAYQVSISQELDKHSFRTITAVTEDGTTHYSLAASIAAVEAAELSFYFDSAASILYIHATGGVDPGGMRIVGEFTLYFCSGSSKRGRRAVVFEGRLYHPRIVHEQMPRVSRKGGDPYFGIIQVGVGQLPLMNLDGAFDALCARYLWEGRTVQFLLGGSDLPYSQYQKIGAGIVKGKTWSDSTFVLHLRDMTFGFLTSTSAEFITSYDLTRTYNLDHTCIASTAYSEYGHLYEMWGWPLTHTIRPYQMAPTYYDPDAVINGPLGARKPRFYGTCTNVLPLELARTSLGADSDYYFAYIGPFRRILGIRDPSGTLSNTYGMQVWEADPVLGVMDIKLRSVAEDGYGPWRFDIEGVPDEDGVLETNPARVIADLVTSSGFLGEIDDTSLEDAAARLDLYTVAEMEVSEGTALSQILAPMLQACGIYVYGSLDGKVSISAWEPTTEATALSDSGLTLTDRDFIGGLSFGDNNMITSSEMDQVVLVPNMTYSASGTSTDAGAPEVPEALSTGATLYRPPSITTPFGDRSSVILASRRFQLRRMRPSSIVQLTTTIRAATLPIMATVVIDRSRMPVDTQETMVCTVIGVDIILTGREEGNVTLTLIDQKCTLEQPFQSFIATDDSDLAWGDATAFQRLSIGFWTDDDGYVVTGDESTYRASMRY